MKYFCILPLPLAQDKLNNASLTLRRLRLVGILEGISYLFLLFVAMPLKYMWGDPVWVQKIGMLHGLLFILYVVLLALGKYQLRFSWNATFWMFVLSLVPFGTFYSDVKFLKKYSA